MPNYNFRDTNTGKEWVENLSMLEREEFLSKNPHIEQFPGKMTIGDPIRLGITRPSSDFNEVIAKAKQAHPRGYL